MKAVIVPSAGGAYTPTTSGSKPSPSPSQLLVKSLASGINPVDAYMQNNGLFVDSWPVVLGCDASGVVVQVGKDVKDFKVGDYVFGCTRLGVVGHGTFQEFFLMDDGLTFKRPKGISTEEAATLGVGTLTASLGLCYELGVEFPESGTSKKIDEWIIVLGGAGSVGQYTVQLAKIAGYKVLASCSTRSDALVKKVGADATFDYKKPEEKQLEDIKSATGGNFTRVFDASGQSDSVAIKALKHCSKSGKGSLATVNDWAPIDGGDSTKVHGIKLGPIGRSGEAIKDQPTVNEDIASYIPKIIKYLEEGSLKPMEYQVVGGVGFESVVEAEKMLSEGKTGGKKLIVRLQEE